MPAAVVMLADTDFVDLMEEAPSSVELRMPAMVLKADPDFIGPMPVIASASTGKTADASNAALNGAGPEPTATHTAAMGPAESSSSVTTTKTAEPVQHLAKSNAASAAATKIEGSPVTTGLATGTASPSTVPNFGAIPVPNHGPTHGVVPGPNPYLHVEPEQLVKPDPPQRSASEEGADKDEGFVSRRVDVVPPVVWDEEGVAWL